MLKFTPHLDGTTDQVLFSGMKIFDAKGVRGGRNAPSVNLGLPHISETTRPRKSKFYTHTSMGPSTLFRYENFSTRGVRGRAVPPSVNIRPKFFPLWDVRGCSAP